MTDSIRICRFCGQQARYTPLYLAKGHSLEVHFCDICQAEYAPLGHSLYITLNERVYRWTVFDVVEGAALYIINEPGVPGQLPNKDVQQILSFKKDVPDITPDNIKDKLSIMLLYM